MEYDIILVTGELFFDHPLCGTAILKRLLEKKGYTVGMIEMPKREEDIKELGKPKLFFGVSSGSIDSMVRNYTPLKKKREEDMNLNYAEHVPDRAITVYSNWIKKHFKGVSIVIGGTEASLRRFVHYDYWQNRLRKPILFDTRADILAYGSAEKQILEIAKRIRKKEDLTGIPGTCMISRELPEGFKEIPSYKEVEESKERFCDMQNLLDNTKNLAQKTDTRYVLQYKSPEYTSQDLDEYYELPFTRKIPTKHLRGFEFSIVTHRGCIGECNFCSLSLTQGRRIISRSEKSILNEIKNMRGLIHFKGNIDDLGGPSANMYGMDCEHSKGCTNSCIKCKRLDKSHKKIVSLLRKARSIDGIKEVNIRSGIRYDLATDEYLNDVAKYHIYKTLRVAPEHVNKEVLRLMNKDMGNLGEIIDKFKKMGRDLSFYFITAHPGSSMNEAKELAERISKLQNTEAVQVFTPTPMTVSTCMYYTGMDPKTKKKIYVPYTYLEKKEQKRILFRNKKNDR